MLESILPYLGIEPRYTEKELAELNRTVPRVTSMTTAEAENSLKTKSLKSQVVGEGVTVIRRTGQPIRLFGRDQCPALRHHRRRRRAQIASPIGGARLQSPQGDGGQCGIHL